LEIGRGATGGNAAIVDCMGEETGTAGEISVLALWRMIAERSTSSFDISISMSIFILLVSYLLK
jgi:hypothetical protein